MERAALRILLVDDNADIREALCSILHDCPDVRIVGEATNGKEAVFTAEKLQPDVVLMDINIPMLDGIAATRAIKAHNSNIAVVGLSANTPDHMVYAMVKAGAFAVMSKENAVEDLYDLIRKAVSSISGNLAAGASAALPPYCQGNPANESEREVSW
jgi:Response regulator containing a CheY-like receiver domain and an HTH DNA-binding domain